MLTIIVVAIFASAALVTLAALYPYLSRREALRRRVDRLISPEKEQPTLIPIKTRWQRFLSDMGGKLKTNAAERRTYREMITSAGFRQDSLFIFLGSKLLLTVALPATYLALVALPLGSVSGNSVLVAIVLAIGGYLVPTIWLRRKAEQRKTEIFYALPDVLDLLTICVEAGLSLNAALVKTVENFQDRNNPLIREIHTVTQEIRIGRPRSEALKGLAERTLVDDIKSFVAMLIQTEKFGTSLGSTLHTYSDSLRMKRKQLAEEQAAKTSIKIMFPLILFVLPALMVVILAPAFFKMAAMFSKH